MSIPHHTPVSPLSSKGLQVHLPDKQLLSQNFYPAEDTQPKCTAQFKPKLQTHEMLFIFLFVIPPFAQRKLRWKCFQVKVVLIT